MEDVRFRKMTGGYTLEEMVFLKRMVVLVLILTGLRGETDIFV
jgi:hypothetical protein